MRTKPQPFLLRLLYHTHNLHALLSLLLGVLLVVAPRSESLRESFVPDPQERRACSACVHSADLQQVLGVSLLFIALLLRLFRDVGTRDRRSAVAFYSAFAVFMLASAVLGLSFVLAPYHSPGFSVEWLSLAFSLFCGVVYSLALVHLL
jgi:hypothetical protein